MSDQSKSQIQNLEAETEQEVLQTKDPAFESQVNLNSVSQLQKHSSQKKRLKSKETIKPSKITLNDDLNLHLMSSIPGSTQARVRADTQQLLDKSQMFEQFLHGQRRVSRSKRHLGSADYQQASINFNTTLPLQDDIYSGRSTEQDRLSQIPALIEELQVKFVTKESSQDYTQAPKIPKSNLKRLGQNFPSSKERIEFSQLKLQNLQFEQSGENINKRRNSLEAGESLLLPDNSTSRNQPKDFLNQTFTTKQGRFLSVDHTSARIRVGGTVKLVQEALAPFKPDLNLAVEVGGNSQKLRAKNFTTIAHDTSYTLASIEDQMGRNHSDLREIFRIPETNRTVSVVQQKSKFPLMNLELQDKLKDHREITLQNIRIKSQTTRNKVDALKIQNQSKDESSQTIFATEQAELSSIRRNLYNLRDTQQDRKATEILQNQVIDQNFRDLSITLNKYLKEKKNNHSVTNREQKEQRRLVQNTYQADRNRQGTQASTQNGETEMATNDSSRNGQVVSERPRSLIKIPKDIILYQMSKKVDKQQLNGILNLNQQAHFIKTKNGLLVVTGPKFKGVNYFFTTRKGGVSSKPYDSLNLEESVKDKPECVLENKRRVRDELPSDAFELRLVHSSIAIDADDSSQKPYAEADASVTTHFGKVLSISTGDCLPVIITDIDAQVLGVAHAGWSGLAAGVLENTLALMRMKSPQSKIFSAWIGPGIGPQAFEVGQDVYDAYTSHDQDAKKYLKMYSKAQGKYFCDLTSLATQRLKKAGVNNIYSSGICTYSDKENFFSDRRDGITGRMALFAWLEKSNTQKQIQNQSYLDYLERGLHNIESEQASVIHNKSLMSSMLGQGTRNQSYLQQDISINQQENKSEQQVGFQITDLLTKTFGNEKSQDKSKDIIRFYKRTVQFNGNLDKNKEIMIKNYRLHVITDEQDLSSYQRQILGLNPGTSIFVSNSIIMPEEYKFTTKIKYEIPSALMPHKKQGSENRKRGFIKDPEDDLRTYMTQFNELYNSEDLMQIQEIEKQYLKFLDPQGNKVIEEEDEFETDSIFQAKPESKMNEWAVKEFQQNFMLWIESLEAKKDPQKASNSPKKAKRDLTKHDNKDKYSPRKREIQNKMNQQSTGLDINETLIPGLVGQSTDLRSYDSLRMVIVDQNVGEWYKQFLRATVSVNISTPMTQKASNSLQTLNYLQTKEAIAFASKNLTHLDEIIFRTDDFPPELFINFDKWIEPIIKELRKWESLKSTQLKPRGLMIETEYFKTDGTAYKIDAKIIDYDPQSAKFLVQNEQLGIKTWRSRLFMRLKIESIEQSQRIRQKALQSMKQTQEFLRLHRIVLEDMCVRYAKVKMPDSFRENIKRCLNLGRYEYNIETLKQLIVQAEALFVFSIFKSTISSQIKDPNIRALLAKKKVPFDSVAIFPYVPKTYDRTILPEISEFSTKECKTSLDQNSLLLMDKKYIQLPIFLTRVTLSTISAQNLFKFPFDVSLISSQGGDSFKKYSLLELDERVNNFPLQHKYFVAACRVVSENFHSVTRFRWCERIYQEIWNFVKDDFDYETGKRIIEDQIDPTLRRLFYQLKLFMQTVMFERFERAVLDFVEFLISFLMRDGAFKDSVLFQQIQNDRFLRFTFQENYTLPKSSSIYTDLSLIPLKTQPFLQVQAVIENKASNKYYTQMESATKPDLSIIKADLISVFSTMHESLKNIERVDKLIFPLLYLENPCLHPPDIKNNGQLIGYLKMLEDIIDQGLSKTHDKMAEIQKFIIIYDKKVENMIMDLKKKTFTLQNEEDENDENSHNLSDVERNSSALSHLSSKKEVPHAQNLNLPTGPDVAFKSIEIDEGLFKEELDYLRRIYWQIQEQVYNYYDFGLVILDCMPFKDKILKYTKSLMDHLENYTRKEFLVKMNGIQTDINLIQSKLNEAVRSIDDVILLLDYIEQLKKPESKIVELSEQIEELKEKMSALIWIKVQLKSQEFLQYLNLLNWPRTFRAFVDQRKIDLLKAKDNLFFEMGAEKNLIFEKIQEFQEQIHFISQEGLILESEIEKFYPVITSEALNSPSFRKKLQLQKQGLNPQQIQDIKSSKNGGIRAIPQAYYNSDDIQKIHKDANAATFKFISQEIKWDDFRFDSDVIEEVYEMTEHLKVDYDSIEKLTAQINKRESLLGVEQTEFKELRTILDDLKPLFDIWSIAKKFSKAFPIWMEGRFDMIESDQIENNVNEWVNELKRLSKNNFLKSAAKQIELLSFMYQALNQFKNYIPLLKALRTRGLALRHWRMIGNKLDFVVDPATVTLRKLINLKLFEQEKLSIIKAICEIATKEYAVMTALDNLDREIKSLEFTLQPLKSESVALLHPKVNDSKMTKVGQLTSETQRGTFQFQNDNPMIVIKLGDLISNFEEYSMRVSVLKTNPYIKNFYDKMVDIERIVKHVVDILNEWLIFQKNWIYLEAIFSLEEINKFLDKESKKFQGIDSYFKQVSKSFEGTPQVYKACQREAFYVSLQRYNQDCESIIQGLNIFLEAKREKFPRLYFLSNEEMIDIFGSQRDTGNDNDSPQQSLRFLSKIFEGIENVNLNDYMEISELISKESETLRLIKPVGFDMSFPEKWLLELEKQMKNGVKLNLFLALSTLNKLQLDKWICSWPGQCLYTCLQIWFTTQVSQLFIVHEELLRIEKEDKSRLNMNLEQSEHEFHSNQNTQTIPTMTQQSPRDFYESPTATRTNLEKPNKRIVRQSVFMDELIDARTLKMLAKEFQDNTQELIILTQPFKSQMRFLLEKILMFIRQISLLSKQSLNQNIRQTVINSISLLVYLRDIQQSLIDKQITNPDDFSWQMLIKFSTNDTSLQNYMRIEKKDEQSIERLKLDAQNLEVQAEVFNSQRPYCFEYLGNSNRLIITPLTERCQRSLLIAMHYFYGGAPEGPVGTGKTETTKDLAKQLGKLCFVMNCSSNFDYQSVIRFFKGISSSGAWVCFDEFNRMDPHILSIISLVIISIQSAIRKQSPSLFIDEAKVTLKSECAIFITLNPFLAGRTELPINLKNLFRPISMVVPDSNVITEVLLFSSGFKSASTLAKLVVQIQNLTNQMTLQQEFSNDFGLRSIKAIVSYAELLKLQSIGLRENDATFIVDDSNLSNIATKSFEIIKEFIQKEQESPQKSQQFNKSIVKGQEQIEEESLQIDDQDIGNDSFVSKSMQSSIFSESPTGRKLKSQRRDGILNKRNAAKTSVVLSNQIIENLYGLGSQLTHVNKEQFYRHLGLDITLGEISEEELEIYIVMKAIKEYNKTKFSALDSQIYGHIIRDTFKQSYSQQNYFEEESNFKKCIVQALQEMSYDVSDDLVQACCDLYEIMKVKHGVIILGETMSGKSTLIQTLENTLNKSSRNELELLILQTRKKRLHEYTKDIEELNRGRNQLQRQKSHMRQSQGSIGSAASEQQQPKFNSTKIQNILVEVYKKTELSDEEMNDKKNQLKLQGVQRTTMNPKSLDMSEFFGSFETETHSWIEGIFSKAFRDFSNDTSKKRKWLVLDGPVDNLWAENLNSILDDNKKMSLANGESIYMSQNMTLLLETDDLNNTTPATVSRCGLIYIHKDKFIKPKIFLNRWIKKLPKILQDYEQEIYNMTCCLLGLACSVYERNQNTNLVYSETHLLWLIKTFFSYLESFVQDYREYDKKQEQKSSSILIQQSNQGDKNQDSNNPTQVHSKLSIEQELLTASGYDIGNEKKTFRSPVNRFLLDEIRQENAIKYIAIWLEASLITSLIWSFGAAFNSLGKQDFNQNLKSYVAKHKIDYQSYLKIKKKQQLQQLHTQNNTEQDLKQTTNSISSSIDRSRHQRSRLTPYQDLKIEGKEQSEDQVQISSHFYDEARTNPYFVSDLPTSEEDSVFDYFYSMDQACWQKFAVEKEINQAVVSYHNMYDQVKKVQNLFIPTIDTIRYQYALECLAIQNVSTILVGQTTTGKSSVLRDHLLLQSFQYSNNHIVDHLTFSSSTNSETIKRKIERKLQMKIYGGEKGRVLEPDLDKELIIYIDDLHLPVKDSFGQQAPIELLRDFFNLGGWHHSQSKKLTSIHKTAIFSVLTSVQKSHYLKSKQYQQRGGTIQVTERLLHNFALLCFDELSDSTIQSLFQIQLSLLALQWPSDIQQYQGRVLSFMIECYQSIQQTLQPSPQNVQYTFSLRDIFKLCNGLMLIESNYLKNQENLMKLLYHESQRVFGDKIQTPKDRDWLNQKLQELSFKHFELVIRPKSDLRSRKSSYISGSRKHSTLTRSQISEQDNFEYVFRNPSNLFFSIFNSEVEGYYVEVENIENVGSVIERMLIKYNDTTERQHINLILFAQINQLLLKIVRVIGTSNGHLLIAAVKGSGVTTLQKLASFALGHQAHVVELISGFSLDEWKGDIKKLLIKAGQDDKEVLLCMDQFSQQLEQQYDDLECIINNNISSEVISPNEIDTCLSFIHQQIETEKLEKLNKNLQNLNNSSLGPDSSRDELSKNQKQALQQQYKTQGLSLIQKNPQLQAELYNYFLKRVKNNFHFAITFSPTGKDFKEKLLKYPSFLLNCTMIWMQEFTEESLLELGNHFLEYSEYKDIKKKKGDEQSLRRIYKQELAKARQESGMFQNNDQINQKVLKACVRMYLDSKEIVKKFFQSTEQILYFTPAHFIAMFSNYKRLYDERSKNVMEIQKRYQTGLENIRVTQSAIQEYHIKLEEKTPQLQEQQKKLIGEIERFEELFQVIKKDRDAIKREEFLIQKYCEDALQIKLQCEEALNKVAPALNEAVNSIQSLSKHDLSELRAMKKPPKVIKLVLKAVCILLQVAPIRKKAKDGINFKDSYWSAAQSKDVLGNQRLPDLLIEYDRNKISQEMMVHIEEVLSDEDYSYENAYRASRAATGMFKWVKAIREYYYIFQEIEPRRDAFMLSEKQYSVKMEELTIKRKELFQFEERLKDLQLKLDTKDSEIEELKVQILDCKTRKKRADILLRGLSSEKQKWIVCTRMLTTKYLTVTGDVLLSSAFISLLSGFTQKFRNKLIKRWKSLLNESGLKVSDNFNFNDLFGDQMKIRAWHIHGLPQDQPSVNNAIIMEKSKKYSICIDPQFQATNWLKNQYNEQGLIVLKYGDQHFKKSIELAIEIGKPVMIQNIGEVIDVSLYSLLKKDIVKHGGQRLISFCRKTFKFDKNFDIFLVTHLRNPNYSVNVANYTTFINFYVTFDGLQQQLLSLVVANERQDLEEKYLENTKDAFENIKGLKDIENAILAQLQVDVDSLLSDDVLIKTLNESRNTAELIALKLKNISQTQQFMQKSRDVFTPVSKRAALLYFAISDLSKINCMYQFSLSWFIHLFKRSMLSTNQIKHSKESQVQKQSTKLGTEVAMKSTTIGFTKTKISQSERIELLIKTFTQELYQKVQASMFDKDRMLFTYFIALRVLEYEEYLDKALYSFLISGSQKLKNNQIPNDLSLAWINQKAWNELLSLSQIRPFTPSTLLSSLKENPKLWDNYFYLKAFSYENLPIANQLNLTPLLPQMHDDGQTQSGFLNDFNTEYLEDNLKGQTTDEDQNRPLTRNVSSVLNDEELWNVSSESEDEQQLGKFQFKKQNLGGGLDEDDNQFLNQEEEMAQYMLETTPAVVNFENQKQDKIKQTRHEYEMRAKKELVLKCLIELCVLRCIRPDKISESFDKFLSIVIDRDTSQHLPENNQTPSARNKTKADHNQSTDSKGKSKTLKKEQKQLSSFMNLLKQAYDDSSKAAPIFFLITHSVHVHATLNELQKSFPEFHQVKIQYLSLGKGLEKKVEEKITKAASAGDWLLLENLHLVLEWLPKLEEIIQKLDRNEVNSKFRLWLSSVSLTNFPANILQLSVKIALQPPSGVKQIMDRMLTNNSEIFRKSKANTQLHKNMYFGLIYLHSVLVGRRKYGTLGWNVPYEFDFSDFEISASQIQLIMRKPYSGPSDDETNLKMVKYLIGEINYSGKIQRNEDRRILSAILEDLFNSKFLFEKYGVNKNLDQSHYGLPYFESASGEAQNDQFQEFIKSLPDNDDQEIYGFNDNINRLLQKNLIFDILQQVSILNSKEVVSNNPVDIYIKNKNDEKVMLIVDQLLERLPQKFNEDFLNLNFKLVYSNPINMFLQREALKYNNLIRIIQDSMLELISIIEGQLRPTNGYEKFWNQILEGKIPERWLYHSYPTCQKTIAHYIQNLIQRIEFINQVLQHEINDRVRNQSSIDIGRAKSNLQIHKIMSLESRALELRSPAFTYWFPGFFDQKAFLICLMQKYARNHNLEIEEVECKYKTEENSQDEETEQYSEPIYINGLWLEGAEWDQEKQLLAEIRNLDLYVPFPRIKILTVMKTIRTASRVSNELPDEKDEANTYECPVFKTTMRLANNIYSVENEPVFFTPLRTNYPIQKWIKRSVALILDINFQ